MKKVSIIMLTIAALLLTLVTASANPTILYSGVPTSGIVNVSVYPDMIAPPISIQYDGESGNMYRVTLIIKTQQLHSFRCEFTGIIDNDPFVLDSSNILGNCSIPAVDHDSIHILTACVGANCSTSNAVATVELYPICNAACWKKMAAGSGPTDPIPEVATIGMVSLGIIGLFVVTRNRKKN